MREFSLFIAPLILMFFGIVTYLESDLPHRRLGYRVLTVKRTLETWQVSNKFAAKVLLICGAITLVVGVGLNSYARLLVVRELLLVNVIELVVVSLLVILLTEWRVNISFNKEGIRK